MPQLRLGPSGWSPVAILTAVVVLDSIDQGLVPGVLSQLQDEWGFSDTLGGAIPSAALVVGFLALIPAGWMADHLRRTRVLTVVVVSWALLTSLSGLAVSFTTFFIVRMALGGASHIDNPVSSSLLADFYPPLVRGRVFAVQRLSFIVGTGIGVALGGAIGALWGWRAAFFVMVIPGLLVAGLVATLHEPTRGGMDDVVDLDSASSRLPSSLPSVGLLEEIEDTAPRVERTGARAYLREFVDTLRIPTVRHLFIGLTVTVLGFTGIAYWLPTYLERDFDLSESKAAVLTGVVAIVAGLTGAMVGGTLGDRRESAQPGARISLTGVTTLTGASFLILGFSLDSLGVLVGALAIGVTLLSIGFPNLAAAAADVLPPARRGTGFAMFSFLLAMGSALGPLVIGGFSEAAGSLQLAIVLAVLPAIPGSIVMLRGRATFAADAAVARRNAGD